MSRAIVLCGVTTAFAGVALLCSGAPVKSGVNVNQHDGRVSVTIDGDPFTDYIFTDTPKPYCYPIYGPGQVAMTRNWPMQSPPGEEHDHPHHRSFWYAHGDVNGIDFWSETPSAGKILHKGFDKLQGGPREGIIQSRNDWVSTNGTVVCSDLRTLRFARSEDGKGRVLDFTITISAPDADVVFGDTKEGSMAIRLAETMRLKGGGSKGHILNSEGVRDGQTWGKRAAWCDYYGPVGGATVGVAMFDHPNNPRHPTWWHVRDYGLFAANPFGRHDFEKLKDKEAGAFTLKKGQTVTFKYRFLFHPGDEKEGNVAAEYTRFTKSQP